MARLILLPVLCLMLLLGALKSPAQPQPAISCVSVSISSPSSVEVSWTIPSGSFDGFRLYYGPAGGTFASLDFPNPTNSANVSVPDVTTEKYEFFLRTYINSPFSLSQESNHLQTILLTIAGDGTGIAKLEWNHQGGSDLTYTVLRSDDNLNYQSLVSVNGLEYYDTISNKCNPVNIYYSIQHGTCNARSNIASALLEDQTPPEDPKLRLVSIENNFAQLMWDPSPSSDVDSIIIERNLGGWFEYQIIANSITFIDNFTSDPEYINACDESVMYIVRAKDLCGLESSGADNYLNPHNTILLSGNTDQLCDRKASLYWNAYNNMDPPVTHYKVERSLAGGPFIGIEDVPASGPTFSYIDHELLEPVVEVKYRIAAVNQDNSLLSHSCELTLIPNPRIVTDFITNFVTVTDNSFLTINISSEPQDVPVEALIFRSSGGVVDMINTVPWDESGNVTIDDKKDLDVSQSAYSYSIQALDSCGNIIAESQEFSSILLHIDVANESDVSLLWNELIGWGTDLQEYQINKYNDGVLVNGYPVSVDAGSTEFSETDNSDALKTTYVVTGVKNDGTIVRSNEVLLSRTAKVDIPTAFRPRGYNSIFHPVLKNVDSDSYLLSIYNRWGQLVFETSDVQEGWDGEFNGSILQGIYIYMISFKDQAGNNSIKRGSVILLD